MGGVRADQGVRVLSCRTRRDRFHQELFHWEVTHSKTCHGEIFHGDMVGFSELRNKPTARYGKNRNSRGPVRTLERLV